MGAPLFTFTMKEKVRGSTLHFPQSNKWPTGSTLHFLNEGVEDGGSALHFLNG